MALTARKAARLEAPAENPDNTRCSYYVARKNRFCRTERREGSIYCHTHARETEEGRVTGDADGPTHQRVPCPVNPNHTVYASRLAKHVKVCPDMRYVTTGLPYYTADIHANRGVPRLCQPARGTPRVTHRDFSPEELAALEGKLRACYDTHVAGNILELTEMAGPPLMVTSSGGWSPSASPMAGPTSDEERGVCEEIGSSSLKGQWERSRKHGTQHAALLQCLRYTLSQSSATATISNTTDMAINGFVELGAGKGGLAVALQELLAAYVEANAVANGKEKDGDSSIDEAQKKNDLVRSMPFLTVLAPKPRIAVIDMDGFRRKGDAKVKRSAIPLERLRINIKDIDLGRALGEQGKLTHWVALGKHLCGACTDFALSCAVDAAKGGVRVPAMVIATCCHQRCELRHLNPPSEDGDSTERDAATTAEEFAAGVTLPGSPPVFFLEKEFAAMTSMSSWAVCGDAVDAEKRAVGYACKRIIDQLRVAYLNRQGFTAVQCRYATTSVTGENVCILAWR